MKYIKYLKNKNLSNNTIKTYLIWINKWFKFINKKTINKKIFILFIKELQKQNLKPNSIKLAYCCIKNFLKFEKYKFIRNLEIKLPSEEKLEKNLVNRNILINELKKLNMNNFYEKRLFIIIYLLLNTGIRAFELLSLKWENIHKNKIYIKGKCNKYRFVFIDEIFFNYIKNERKGFLVTKQNLKKGISQKQLNLIIKKFSNKINENFTPHDLRRSFCTHLIKNGCNIKTVQKLMGHSNISITSRYIFTTEEEMFESYINSINK